MREELLKLKERQAIIFIIMIVAIPIIDLLWIWYSYLGDYYLHTEAYDYDPYLNLIHPSKAAFLSGTSIGHLGQMLLIWLMPIYLLLIYGGRIVTEIKCGYLSIIYTKMSKGKYVFKKTFFSFLLGFSVMFLSLLMNFLLACLLFKEGSSFGGAEEGGIISHNIFQLSINYPFLSYGIYMLVCSLIIGLYNIFCTAVAFVVKSKIILYPIVCFVWILLIINPYSLTYIIQPFIEYGLEKIQIAIGAISVVGIVGIILTLIYIRRKDEIF